MQVFMTGATGYIGSAVAAAARAAGYDVLAAAHDADAAAQLAGRGIATVPADLADSGSLARYASQADAVIHVGMAVGPDAPAIDRRATETLVATMGRRPVVYTSGVWVLGATGPVPATEAAPLNPIELVSWRASLEEWLAGAARRGAYPVIIRPGVAHGHGGGIPGRIARGELPLIAAGEQHWSVVHVDDLAELYVAALERARPGAILHGVGEIVRVRTLVRGQGGDATAVRSLDLAAARATIGPFAEALAIEQHVSAEFTRAVTGWTPRRHIGVRRATEAAQA
jgi:nucleoside-diphosphate-sugar epimerase